MQYQSHRYPRRSMRFGSLKSFTKPGGLSQLWNAARVTSCDILDRTGSGHGEPGSMKLRPARFERVARRLYRSLGPGTARGPPGFRAHHSRLRQDSSLHATRRLRERRMPQTVRGRHGSCSCASQTSSGSSARTRSWPSVCGSSSSPNQTATSPQTTTGRPPVSTTTT
jgi:hypothetical protein